MAKEKTVLQLLKYMVLSSSFCFFLSAKSGPTFGSEIIFQYKRIVDSGELEKVRKLFNLDDFRNDLQLLAEIRKGDVAIANRYSVYILLSPSSCSNGRCRIILWDQNNSKLLLDEKMSPRIRIRDRMTKKNDDEIAVNSVTVEKRYRYTPSVLFDAICGELQLILSEDQQPQMVRKSGAVSDLLVGSKCSDFQ